MKIDDILKRNCSRKSKTTKTADTVDIYRSLPLELRRKVDYKLFVKIIGKAGDRIIDLLFKTCQVKLPFGLGRIELRRVKTFVKVVDGKIVTNRPNDWKRTLELWENDDEARLAHKKVKTDNKQRFIFKYRKDNATFKNSWYTRLYLKRDVKLRLKDAQEDYTFDAYLNE